jgi:hypothetical protein
MDDLAFMDGLQKIHTKMVGFMQTKALEGKIKAGHVLVAESDEATERRSDEGEDTGESASAFPSVASSLRRSVAVPVGYLIGNDQYFKRDDVGIIYQMNVVPGKQRGFVGATLLKAMFDRAAYGCKLFCCWCAQDIEANRFWESLGFVPLAFRAGSRGKGRVHIFWQRRIRAGDTTTPYWFPSQTTSGSIREDRLVLPIPPGKRWSDQMPRVLPQGELPVDEPKRLPGTRAKKVKAEPKKSIYAITRSKLHFTVPMPAKAANQKAPREKRKAVKNDPRLVAAARELRDRWVERVNADPTALLPHAKYEVGRALVAQAAPLQIAA